MKQIIKEEFQLPDHFDSYDLETISDSIELAGGKVRIRRIAEDGKPDLLEVTATYPKKTTMAQRNALRKKNYKLKTDGEDMSPAEEGELLEPHY